ncbi:MAG TPA: M15 family metallopeptidase [Acidimicrobiales bacterium]|nr:M15 family metallopeptidase [Acidimicrobiales bacterium]
MTRSRLNSPGLRVVAVALLAVAPVVAGRPVLAAPGQEGPATQRDGQGPVVEGTVTPGDDGLRSDAADPLASLDGLSSAVQAEVGQVLAARVAQATAQSDLDAATAAVGATEARLAELDAQSDAVVIEAFVNPPAASALDVLSAETVSDATVKQSILTAQTDANAAVLTELDTTRAQLEAQQAVEDAAAEAAAARASEADGAVADLVAAQSRESLFVLALQDAMDGHLAEAEALARIDPAAAEAIRAREAEIAGRINEVVGARQQREAEAAFAQAMADAMAQAAAADAARSAARSGSGGSRAGAGASGLATAACPGGGSITVAGSIVGDVSALLSAASADGLDMCGGGYRDPAEQIALRRAHCGTSDYAIYEAPASSCSPPTARPGTSNHETGLAIDFTCGGSTIGSGSACFRWLDANAGRYGLYNLPSEPWHWSTDGT